MRRTNWKTISTLVTMVALVGCQENIATPAASPSAAPARIAMAPAGHPTLSLSSAQSGDQESDFTVDAAGGTFVVGSAAVSFPANSICDPNRSVYAMGTWDTPCPALRGKVKIHAVSRTENGRVSVDFTPSLRFVPSKDPQKWVWLFLHAPGAVNATELSQFNILYVPVFGGAGYDESVNNPTLRTYVDTKTGVVLRRVQHFSGYASSSGADCLVGTICAPM
jgi:hypothetical protein